MAAAKKQRYDVAINGQGFVLALKPEQPALKARQNDIFSQRIAQGDRDYNDFISWWYLAQTDWYAGFKDVVMWADDSHYYYSTNIDPFTQPGALQLALAPVLSTTLTENIYCGGEFTVNSIVKQYVGTDDNSISNKPIVYRNDSGSWTDISSASMATSANVISQLNDRNNYLWIHTIGIGNATVINYFDGTTWTDVSANISTALGWGSIQSSRTACKSSSGAYYVFCDDPANKNAAIVKCTKTAPTAAGDWTVVLSKTSTTEVAIASVEFNGKIYYIIDKGSGSNAAELRVYDPTASTDSIVSLFRNISFTRWGEGNCLQVLNNVLIITMPPKQQWTYDGTDLKRIYIRDSQKNTLSQDAYAYLTWGGVISDNRFYSGNYVTDLTNFYNYIKDAADTAGGVFIPLFVDGSNNIWGYDNQNQKKLYEVTVAGSTYKSTSGSNYLVFNNFDKVSGIDKLAFKLTFIFKTLVSGQSLTWEYLLGELTSSSSWTTLGSASFATDGAITTKDLYFGDNVLFKKIWFRVKLDGGGSNTPVLYDGPVLAYLPMPDYKLHWEFTVKCQNKMRRKDQSKETKDGLWLRNFLQNAWLTKSILSFEDFDSMVVDYVADNPLTSSNATITVKGNTDSFPEFGRLLIDSEEIFYSGKTKTTFLNCTRGQRGSIAVSHTLNTQISMAHRVIIRNYTEDILIANEALDTEYHVSLALQEV